MEMRVFFLEIYHENLRDLLSPHENAITMRDDARSGQNHPFHRSSLRMANLPCAAKCHLTYDFARNDASMRAQPQGRRYGRCSVLNVNITALLPTRMRSETH